MRTFPFTMSLALLFLGSLGCRMKPSGPAQISDLVGTWDNKDANTHGITRIALSSENGALLIRAWGKCRPSDCDWGEVLADTSKISNGTVTARWDLVDGHQTLRIALAAPRQMLCDWHSVDAAGASSPDEHYHFSLAQQQPSPKQD
jgi:hypothetical protein